MHNEDYTKYSNRANKNETVEEVTSEVVFPKNDEEIKAEALSVESTETDAAKVESTPEAPKKMGCVYNCTKLNVRCAPYSKADVVCVIDCDTEVEIDEFASTNDFYKICTATGIEGYCIKTYILEI